MRHDGERGAKGGSHYGHGVVVEDCGDIFRGKLVGRIADEKTCLADSTVADDNTPAEKMGLVRGCMVWKVWWW